MKTNLAIAIDYEPGKMDTPVLETSGIKEVTQMMKRIALRYGIPIEENDELAEKLFTFGMTTELPEGCYEEIAELFLRNFKFI